MTPLDLITDALRRLNVISEIDTPSAEQGSHALAHLNDMFAEMLADDIDLGWNPKPLTTSTCVLPAEHVNTIKAMLALRLVDTYGATAPQGTVIEATKGYNRLQRQGLLGIRLPTDLSNIARGEGQGFRSNILTDD